MRTGRVIGGQAGGGLVAAVGRVQVQALLPGEQVPHAEGCGE
ncbi:MAG TPA: hypothetical protein PKD75_10325 [Tepidiformaceae bacterium]|nr:hypothetical protein [Tepidiformaceae bacterium]